MPRPQFTPGEDSVPILQEAGWAPGPVWTGGKSLPHRDSIPDRPAQPSISSFIKSRIIRKGEIKINIIFRAVVSTRMSNRIPYMAQIFSNS